MMGLRSLGVFLLLLLPPEKEQWLVTGSSSLTVNGSTNINKFSCEIPAYGQADTLTLTRNGKGAVLTGTIGLKVQGFDCHNSLMTRDLRKTLKQQQFPQLYIQFLSLSEIPVLSAKAQPISGLVNIQLAGVTKRLEVSYQITVDADHTIHLLGCKAVNFSDFNLVPPTKLGGMIRTNDLLQVSFHLVIKTICPSKEKH